MRFTSPHLDSTDTVWFNRQLEAIDAKNYMDLLPGALARKYIPTIENVPAWAASYTYRRFTQVGRSKIIAPNANDLPKVNLRGQEMTRTIKQLGNSYGWTMREIQQAAGTRTPLDEMTVQIARSATEREIDDLLALGNSDLGIEGLLSLTGVDSSTATTKTSGTTWTHASNVTDADNQKILADINKMTTDVFDALKQTDAPGFNKFVLLLPTPAYAVIATRPRSANSDMTLLRYALENNPWLESIEPWYQCNAAGSGPSGRAVLYPRNPVAVGALVPEEFNSKAPQERGLNVEIPTSASCGGTVCRYPVALRYMDGIS